MYGPSITHNEKHFAKKTTLKLDESLKKIIFVYPPAPFMSKMVICMFLIGIVLRDALKNS